MQNSYNHLQAAHCENGVTAGMLQHIGVTEITEPLAFGIGSGIFYIHIPFIKINNGPAISFRTMPGLIFKRTCTALNIPVVRKKYSSKEKAQQDLDERLTKGEPAACQVGVFYLPYFPKEYRFHFNAHNLIVTKKEGDQYTISDPIMETLTTMSSYELERVRFAKGALAPRGQLYYPKVNTQVTAAIIKEAIVKGVKRNVRDMLSVPGYFVGVKGIAYTGRKIKTWKQKLGDEKARNYLAQLVRMQEEIGTGGGGFRYIYAAFLQQAQQYINHEGLNEVSQQFTQAGDQWRNAAIQASGIYKGRLNTQQDYDVMGDMLIEIAELEKNAFQQLKKIIKEV